MVYQEFINLCIDSIQKEFVENTKIVTTEPEQLFCKFNTSLIVCVCYWVEFTSLNYKLQKKNKN